MWVKKKINADLFKKLKAIAEMLLHWIGLFTPTTLSFSKYNKHCLSYSGYMKIHPLFHFIFSLFMLRNFHKQRAEDFGLEEVLKNEKCMRSKKISSE